MGQSVSRRVPSVDSHRPPVVLSSLNFFDLVLIRSAVEISGVSVDSRVAAHIKANTSGFQTPTTTTLQPFNRIGLLLLPSFTHPSDFTLNNLTVIEANSTAIQSKKLQT